MAAAIEPAAALIIAIGMAGCASAPVPAASEAVQRECAAQMYAARQPRSAPNWALYDDCVRERQARRPAAD